MLLKKLTSAAIILCSASLCMTANQTATAAEAQTVVETCNQIKAKNKAIAGGLYGVFDSNLKWVLQPTFRQIIEFAPDYFFVIKGETNSAALIDTSVTPHKEYPLDDEIRKAGDFREHRFGLGWLNVPVEVGEDPRRHLLQSFGHEGSFGMKRVTGEIFIDPLYDDIVFCGDGKSFEARSHDKKTNKKTTTIIDSSGRSMKFENIAQLNGTLRFGISAVEAQTKPGEPQRFSDEMDAKKRDQIERAAQGRLKLKWIDNRHHAVIDLSGKYVLPPSAILLQPISHDKFIANPLGPDWQRFYKNLWAKELDGCAMFAYFLKDYDLIGMSRNELLSQLGPGDSTIEKDETGDELIVYSRMRNASVQIKLRYGKVSAWRMIDKDHQEPWIEKNVLIPDAPYGFLTNVQYAAIKLPGADLPGGKVFPPGSPELE